MAVISGCLFKRLLVIPVMLLALGGCAAAQLAMDKKGLDVQTHTSVAIFVAPVASPSPKLFLDIRSSVIEFDSAAFRRAIKQQLRGNNSDYTLTNNPDEAVYFLSVSVLNLEKAVLSAAELALEQGYGGPPIGQTMLDVRALGGFDDSEDFLKALAASILVGAVEGAINSLVSDVSYMLVTDVEVSERPPENSVVKVDTEVNVSAGDDGQSTLTEHAVSDRIKYRTRIVTTANKANLKLDDAKGLMFDQMAYAIAGIFAKSEIDESPSSAAADTDAVE